MSKLTHLHLPHYHVQSKPDHEKIGAEIDAHLRAHYSGDIVVRAISMQEKTEPLDDVINQILTQGTDIVDSNKTGRGYERAENIDFFGVQTHTDKPMTEKFIERFYSKPLLKGGQPLRTDIYMIYDPKKVVMVPHEHEGKQKKYGFRFKEGYTKQDALLGVLKVT